MYIICKLFYQKLRYSMLVIIWVYIVLSSYNYQTISNFLSLLRSEYIVISRII